MNRARLGFIKFAGTAAGVILVGRLFTVQVIQANYWQETALHQYQREIKLQARRGAIYDRAYRKLAVDLEYFSYGINPGKVVNRGQISRVFGNTLGLSPREVSSRLRSDTFVWLARKVKLELAEKIDRAEIPNLASVKQYGRFYPAAETAAQVVGYSDVDNTGLSGLELQFDDLLRGADGRMIRTSDARGRHIPKPGAVMQAPVDGNNLVLTIDLMYQAICEEELRKAVQEHNAEGGRVILMDPVTGEILSMNCYPGFDPNKPGQYPPELRKNRVITDQFEPGSTFKLITLSAALEEGVVAPDTKVFCENGSITVAGHTIHDDHSYGTLSVREVFELSSNIGAYKIAQLLGGNKLYECARDFGIGTKTGCGLVGEMSGLLRHPKEWSKLTLPSMSFGYEIMVTAFHMVNAYSAIANGGVLMQPYIIHSELDASGRPIRTYGPKKIRRVVSKAVADTLLSFMEGVVLRGTAKEANVPGWRVGGKTGTARKAVNGRYNREYIGSFVGVYPIEAPRFVCYMMIDSPKGQYYGGLVAAPAVRRILQRIGTLPGAQELVVWDSRSARRNPETVEQRSPDLLGQYASETSRQLRKLAVPVRTVGDGDIVVAQRPAPGVLLASADTLVVRYGDQKPEAQPRVRVPRLTGLSMREAVILLGQHRLRPAVEGSGKVIQQYPAAGASLPAGAHCRLTGLKPAAG